MMTLSDKIKQKRIKKAQIKIEQCVKRVIMAKEAFDRAQNALMIAEDDLKIARYNLTLEW
jgi:hypothetical protein